MGTERWERVQELFEQAADLPIAERSSFLDQATSGDEEIRREVDSLLTADEQAEEFLEKPAAPGRLTELLEHSETHAKNQVLEGHIGPYRLLRELGEGGMSRVYLAVRDDDQFEKLVAIKVIRDGPHSRELVSRFRTERQILASLDHPNIARILDGGSTKDGLPYFVMEYIEGDPIDEYCDQARLPIVDRIKLFLPIFSAVAYAHQNLIVHRDLKTSNILVTKEGVPKLLDFGIAKLLKPEQFALPLNVTSPDFRPLTPYYASPEQIEGGLITTSSDVYSLGVLLYKLLTGHFPYRFERSSAKEVERVVLETDAEAPSTAVTRSETRDDAAERTTNPDLMSSARSTHLPRLRRQLTGDLDNILLMALRKEPQRRYESVRQFAGDLERFLNGEPVLAHGDNLGYRVTKFLRRNRLATGVAASFLALLIGFSIVVSIQARKAAVERDQAQLERDRAEQVVRFLQGIFHLSDPNRAGGETITAREILDQGAARIDQELVGQPIVRASLMEAIGNVYRNLGLYDSAEELLQLTLETREEVLGSDSLAVAQTLNNLGIVLRSKGDLESAEPFFRKSLELRRRKLGESHPDVAQSLHNLGSLRRELGDYPEAEELYGRAIANLRQTAEKQDELAESIGELAILRSDLGDFERAEQLFREALDIRRSMYPRENTLVAKAVNDLAVLLAQQGDLDSAGPLFLEAYETRRKLLGDEHPVVAESLNNLARLHQELGEFERAEELYRQAIEVHSRVYGREYPRVATLTSNLALSLQKKGDLAQARNYHREALEIRLMALGEDHPDVGISLKNLGVVEHLLGNHDDAKPLLRESIEVFSRALPSGHWRTAEAHSYLGECLVKTGQFEEAEPLLIDSFEAIRKRFGPDHRRTREAQERLLGLFKATGRSTEAEKYQV